MPTTPMLAEVIRLAVEQHSASMSVGFPARVVRYNVSRETVDVQPQIQRAYEDDNGDLVHEDLPILPDVPVMWPSGGGGTAFITWPLAEGDSGLVIVCDRDPSMWRETGQPGPNGDQRAHHVSAGTFWPGLRSSKELLGASKRSETKVVIGSEVFLGNASAGEAMVKGTAFKAYFDTHAHSSAMGPTGGPIVVMPASVLSTKHKIDS
jgi:hypothetical protein